MPMSFPNMESLVFAAKVHKFREPKKGESDQTYRRKLADHVTKIDTIEGHEIRTGKGWDKWTEDEKRQLLLISMTDNL